MSMQELRRRYSPSELLGKLAFLAGLTPEYAPASLPDLLPVFRWPTPDDALKLGE